MVAFAFLEYALLLITILRNAVVESYYTDPIVYPTSYDDLLGTHTIYTFFKKDRSWNEARAECKSTGGDLAKVPSSYDVTAMSDNNKEVKSFFENKYFSSAVRLTEDQYLWMSDCSNGTVSESSRFKKFDDSNTYPACVTVHEDHFHVVDCNSHIAPFLCETKTRTPCNLVKILDTEVIKFDYMNESACNELCNGDVTCWAAITTPTHCIKATIPGYGLSSLPMSTKQCYSTYEVLIRNDNSKLPAQYNTVDLQKLDPPDCANYSGNSPPLPIPTSTNPPVTTGYLLPNPTSSGPPEVIFSTKIVMSTEFTTMYVTSTELFVCPTEYVTTTVTATVSFQTDSVTVTPTSSGVVNDQVDMQLIPPKSTSTYRRSLTSAMDMRRTSIVIGSFSVALVIIPLWTIMFSDMKAIIRHFRNHRTIYSK